MGNIKFCKKCIQPDTRPSIQFDKNGVCPACRIAEGQPDVDWSARLSELKQIVRESMKHNRSPYDCVIGVSGGKDSLRQAMFARDELGLHPLLVCCSYPPEQVTTLGVQNLSNLISLGFDCITVSPAPGVWKKLMKQGFLMYGNWGKSTEMALYASAPKVAVAYHIPLVFLGENPAITVGEMGTGSVTGDAGQMKNSNTIASGPEELAQAAQVDRRYLTWYQYSSDEELDLSNLRIIYLGYYIWDFAKRANAEFSMHHGLKVRNDAPEDIGDITGHEALDDDFVIENQMMKFLKLGFGKVTDQVCEEMRLGKMTRKESIELVKKYDGCCAPRYIQAFCKYLGITNDTFWQIVDKYVDRDIFQKDQNGRWVMKQPFNQYGGDR
jgi:N-acetyl sugar amidotransferase